MPRPRHAQGRPDTLVIPADWSSTHAPVVAKALRGQCLLRPAAQLQERDPATGLMVAVDAAPFWEGPCRVQELGAQSRRTVVTADDTEVAVDYLVVVPLDTPLIDGPMLVDLSPTPTDVLDDRLAGRVLVVVHAEVGTERFERDLFCSIAT